LLPTAATTLRSPMGPSRSSQMKSDADRSALLKQIAELKLERDALASHASGLQSRLLSTIDILDATRIDHAHELATERRIQHDLHLRIAAARKALEDAEMARDDMRDAVLQLIEKGARASHARPHSRSERILMC
jgi:hypothetical protein